VEPPLLSAGRPWLLALAAIFLAIGIVQIVRARKTCQRQRPLTIVTYGLASLMIAGVTLFPQATAGFIADVWPAGSAGAASVGQPVLVNLDGASLPSFIASFNDSSDRARVILLLSPT
jgi:hypothetical protein